MESSTAKIHWRRWYLLPSSLFPSSEFCRCTVMSLVVCHIFIKKDLNILPSALGPVNYLKAFLAMEDSLLCITLLEPFTRNFLSSFWLIKALALLSFMVWGVSPCMFNLCARNMACIYVNTMHQEIPWGVDHHRKY